MAAALLAATPATANALARDGGRAAGIQAPDAAATTTASEQELRDAPAARDIWSWLEHLAPVVVSERLDVGGSASGRQGLFSARGTSWEQNTFRLDGVEVTDPARRGAAGFYFDYGALSSLEASWGGQPAGVATPGVLVAATLESGGDVLHGAVQGSFGLDALQAGNLSPELEAAGAGLAAEIDYLADVSVQAGGPLARGRAWIFGAYRDWRIGQAVVGHVDPVTTELPVATVKVTGRAGAGDDLGGFWSRQRYRNPARNAAPSVAVEANSVEDSTFNALGADWRHPFAAGGAVDAVSARLSRLDVELPLLLQPGAVRQSQLDIVTGLRTGAAPLEIVSSRRRYEAEAIAELSATFADAEHELRAGVQLQHAPTETAYRANGDVNLVTSGGAPLVAQLLDTPVESRQNARAVGLFIHDDVDLGGRWHLSLGLRYDDWKGWLPAQSSPAGTYSEARSFAATGDAIGWRGLAPRAALTFDPRGDGRIHVVVGFAQYVHQLGTSTLSIANPNTLGSVVVPWTDLNGDLQFQPGEGGAVMSVTGAAAGEVDGDLQAPVTRELRAGVGLDLGSGWQGRADLWYRRDSRLLDDVEVGLQPADFVSETVLDPGRDNIPGTGDDLGIQVANQIAGFGDNHLLLTSVDEKIVRYRGMDLTLERPWADGWEVRAVLTLALAEGLSAKSGPVRGDAGGVSDLFNDPNSLINADARLFWDRPYVLKVYGAWRVPHGVMVSGVLRSWSGAPLGRILPVPLNQGPVDVWVEPLGALREAALSTVDARIAKGFGLGGSRGVEVFIDLYNLTNAGTVTRTADTYPRFGTPAELVAPFLARLGARISF